MHGNGVDDGAGEGASPDGRGAGGDAVLEEATDKLALEAHGREAAVPEVETKVLDERCVHAKGVQELSVGERLTGRPVRTGADLGLGEAIGIEVAGIGGGSWGQGRQRANRSGGQGCTKERGVKCGGCAQNVGGKLAEGKGMRGGRGGITGDIGVGLSLSHSEGRHRFTGRPARAAGDRRNVAPSERPPGISKAVSGRRDAACFLKAARESSTERKF